LRRQRENIKIQKGFCVRGPEYGRVVRGSVP
jgi:hypothetical protein